MAYVQCINSESFLSDIAWDDTLHVSNNKTFVVTMIVSEGHVSTTNLIKCYDWFSWVITEYKVHNRDTNSRVAI